MKTSSLRTFCCRESISFFFFCMTFHSFGLLEVCMMTHRAPLSPASTTHEPWPPIPHMWVWDAVAVATALSTEAFARCPWIVGVSSFESLCRCNNDGGGRWVREETCSGCIAAARGLDPSEAWLRVYVWGLLGQKGLCLSLGEGKKISVAHLSSRFPSGPLLFH